LSRIANGAHGLPNLLLINILNISKEGEQRKQKNSKKPTELE
jgi:hypothetical protein